MIEIKNLTKRYGDKLAVNNVSFTVNEGEIVGFLGPNGAGKSTTMNILTGYLSASEGHAVIGGFDILDSPAEAKKQIGYLPEQPPLYMDMTVDEYLSFMYDLKKVRVRSPRKDHLTAICDLVKIGHVRKRMIRNLSKGYKQRVGIAQALLGNPPVLVLDEPTVGLDPKQIIEIRALIKNLSESHTVILSSHILPEIQAVCDRVIVISNGKLVADDTEANLSKKLSDDLRFTLRIAGPEAKVLEALQAMSEIDKVQSLGEKEPGVCEYIVDAVEEADIRREMFKLLADKNWPIMSLRSSELTLEDIFLQLTNENYADDYVEEVVEEDEIQEDDVVLDAEPVKTATDDDEDYIEIGEEEEEGVEYEYVEVDDDEEEEE